MSTAATPSRPRSAPLLSVLIVGYRNRSHLENCIGGALESCHAIETELLFIDCSNDGSEHFVRTRFPTVKVIPFLGNLGFGRANNHLAAQAQGEFLLLLNPDTVPREREISRLVGFAHSKPHAGAWGGRTIQPDGSPDFGSHQPPMSIRSIWLSAMGLSSLHGRALPKGPGLPQRVNVISGAFLLIKREIWLELNGFDPAFFMYAEEVDLCRRIENLGKELWADPTIELVHDAKSGNRYDPMRRLQQFKGNSTFLIKHYGPVGAAVGRAGMFVQEMRRFAQARLRNIVSPNSRSRAIDLQARMMLARCAEWWNGWAGDATHQ